MRTFLSAAIVATILLAVTVASNASARGAGGHGGATMGRSVQNSNGFRAADRDKGLARADDRRNAHSVKNQSLKPKAMKSSHGALKKK